MTDSNLSPGHSPPVASSSVSAVEISSSSIPKFRIVKGRGLGERKQKQSASQSPPNTNEQERMLSSSHAGTIQRDADFGPPSYLQEASQFAFPNTSQLRPSYPNPKNDGSISDVENNNSSCYPSSNTPHKPYAMQHTERRIWSPASLCSGIAGMQPGLNSHDKIHRHNAESSERRLQHIYPSQPSEPTYSNSRRMPKMEAKQQKFQSSRDRRLMPQDRISPGSYYSHNPQNMYYMQVPGSMAPQLHMHHHEFQQVSNSQKQQQPFSYEMNMLNGINSVQPSHQLIYQQQRQNTYPINSTNDMQPANLQIRRSAKLVPLDLSRPPGDSSDNSPLMGLLNSSPPCTIPENERISQCLSFLRNMVYQTRKDSVGHSPIQKQNNFDSAKDSIVSLLCADMSVDEFAINMSCFITPDMANKMIPILRVTIAALRTAVANGDISTDCVTGNPLPSIKSKTVTATENNTAVEKETNSPDHAAETSSTLVDQNSNQTLMEFSNSFAESNEQENDSLPSETSCAAITDDVIKEPVARSVSNKKIEMFASPDAILAKIFKRLPADYDVDEAAVELISDAVQEKMREISSNVISLAAHRLISYRSHKDYTMVDDTKAQLQYIERLLKKGRSNWQMQCHDKKKSLDSNSSQEYQNMGEQMKTSRADQTALKALGKSSNVFGDNTAANVLQPRDNRPRTIRVTMRDLHLQLSSSRDYSRSYSSQKIAFNLN